MAENAHLWRVLGFFKKTALRASYWKNFPLTRPESGPPPWDHWDFISKFGQQLQLQPSPPPSPGVLQTLKQNLKHGGTHAQTQTLQYIWIIYLQVL